MKEKIVNRIVVLMDNNNGATQLKSEHGFSVLIENKNDSIIFDFGKSNNYWNNAISMGINLAIPSIGVLSHGHYDHGGGLKNFLLKNQFANIYAHPAIFKDRYSLSTGEKRYIGLDKDIKEHFSHRFILTKKLTEISENIWFLGEISNHLKWKNLILEDGTPDLIEDDSAIIIKGENGLLVISGCCHSGVMSLLTEVNTLFPNDKIIALMGGLHLSNAPEDYYYLTLQAILKFNVQNIGVGHCTGVKGTNFLVENLKKDQLFSLYSGFIINYI